MDDIVKAALKKWPSVPHCYDWLALDARGDWYMRDDRAQHAGAFPQSKGSRIEHDKLREFIARNYEHDDAGRWFFQNGPQRVYVELEAAPYVWRIDVATDAFTVTAHTGDAATMEAAWLDDAGRLFLRCRVQRASGNEQAVGLVHTLDTGIAAQAIEGGHWTLQETRAFADVPSQGAYVLSPAAAHRPTGAG